MQSISFPEPVRIQGSTRFPLSRLERYERESLGAEIPPRDPADEIYLSIRQAAHRYGVSVPTIWRWAKQTKEAA